MFSGAFHFSLKLKVAGKGLAVAARNSNGVAARAPTCCADGYLRTIFGG